MILATICQKARCKTFAWSPPMLLEVETCPGMSRFEKAVDGAPNVGCDLPCYTPGLHSASAATIVRMRSISDVYPEALFEPSMRPPSIALFLTTFCSRNSRGALSCTNVDFHASTAAVAAHLLRETIRPPEEPIPSNGIGYDGGTSLTKSVHADDEGDGYAA